MKYNNIAFKITIYGETHTLSEWADMYELYPSTILCRYNTGYRDYELLEPIHKDKLDEDFVHELRGGRWVYTGKRIIRKAYKQNLKWVYTG